jgi:hypothetical protein
MRVLGKWLYGLVTDLHGDKYIYVEHKDDKMARRENQVIGRS